ncbi:isochorismatase family protein [Bradyrhizobium genosp. L]|uniref:cysteine hydrolase family protein n=1 Tax=Bradyrhizobium genosp. L TaxID=83637 RepID=UPI0018A2FC14|nr:isochorismatase family protein [Bradyrhizobium genosp. L]QPF83695.1 isochorismatase family protein [Bradyrhizobium genosp. L]
MSSVINLRSYVGASSTGLLVMVDLQTRSCEDLARDNPQLVARVLDNCRVAIRHARAIGLPIAFTRRCDAAAPGERAPPSPWIAGFEPKRADMVFEREQPSCYGNPLFEDVVSRIDGFAIAGFCAEDGCLATAIDAFHRGKQVTFLDDASISRPRYGVDAAAVHAVAARAIELFADASATRQWLLATAQRPLKGHRYG